MIKTILAFLIFSLSSCTYTITQVHTQGTASDVVDEVSTNTPSTSLTVPVSAIK